MAASGGTARADQAVTLTMSGSLIDTDGSEEFTSLTITGVPANVSLTQNGTALTRNLDGSYTLPSLTGLAAVSSGYVGTFNAVLTVASRERVATDSDFNFSNNNDSDAAPFSVTFTPIAQPPVINVNGGADGQVYEDGVVVLPVSVIGQGTNDETMVVTISGLPAGWAVQPVLNGTVVQMATSITITLPANTNLSGSLSFTPPANSDVNSPAITITAVATEPSNGDTASSTDIFVVEVDAVADNVNISAVDAAGMVGQTIPLNLSTSLRDLDGSEEITSVTITGIPVTASLSGPGGAYARNGDGSYSLTVAQLTGLQVTLPTGAAGFFDAVLTVASRERVATDSDFDFTNNNATASDPFRVTYGLDALPPTINVNGGADGQVYEDQSVVLPVSVIGNGTNDETMVVTISGLPTTTAGWTSTPALTGGTVSYVPGSSTITVTLPANTNLGGSISFTPRRTRTSTARTSPSRPWPPSLRTAIRRLPPTISSWLSMPSGTAPT